MNEAGPASSCSAACDDWALGKLLAENQYSAYFWHPLLIVLLQMAIAEVSLAPLVKFALVTLVGVPLVFAWSHILRLLAPVRKVL